MTETIRRGTRADVEAIAEIGKASATAPRWDVVDYSIIFSTERTLLIAEVSGEIAGFIVGRDIAGEWELENIVVADRFRQRSIGQRLVWELILLAKKSDAKFIFLEVRESNLAAKRLYERCGFHPYGRRKDYYSNPVEGAVLYRFLCNPGALENC
jgi:ribosomal-protein-alanine N-acetyltransferase